VSWFSQLLIYFRVVCHSAAAAWACKIADEPRARMAGLCEVM